MHVKKIMLVCAVWLIALTVKAQDPGVVREYITTYRALAIAEMQRTGVPASIKLAQGIHETSAGTSPLVRKSNNHFGIKCKSNWTGPSVSHDDDARGECFRKYDLSADSYRDHSNFLKGSQRYASLFQLDPLDYSAWAYGLKKAGYATNPKYPQIIIRLIEQYHLQDYTLIAMGKMPAPDDVILADAGAPASKDVVQAAVTTAVTVEKEEALHYPSGEFRINETRVVYANKGTALLALAQQYHVSLSKLLEFNDLAGIEELEKDQLVYLQRKRKTGTNEFHVVKPGETLYDIAQTEAIRMESMLAYNQLQAHMQPAPGERLYLRSQAPGMPKLAGTVRE